MPDFDSSCDFYRTPSDEGSDEQLDQPDEVVHVDMPEYSSDEERVPDAADGNSPWEEGDFPERRFAPTLGEAAVRASEEQEHISAQRPVLESTDEDALSDSKDGPLHSTGSLDDDPMVISAAQAEGDDGPGGDRDLNNESTYEADTSALSQDNEIQRYLAAPRQGFLELDDPVSIPTIDGTTTFTLANTSWQTNSTVDEYRVAVLRDQYDEKVTLAAGDLVTEAVPTPDQSLVVAGGEDAVFAPGNRVLDLGSGEALGVLGFGEAHPDSIIVGVDNGYGQVRKVDLDMPGVHLTGGDWKHLDLPDASMDAIIMRNGPLMWEEDLRGLVAEASRVAAPEAILRFEVAETYDFASRRPEVRHNIVMALFREKGWDITVQRGSAVGIKRAPTLTVTDGD